jgi:asparagine synthase (glutamine-hydrolysing)
MLPESDRSANWGNRFRRFVRSVELPMPERYIDWTRFFSDAALAALATPALRARWSLPVEDTHHAAYAARGHDDPVDGAFRIDLATYLPNDLLVMADRMSMAHSLELRAPFCDHLLIEESLRLPPALKLPGFRLKGFLKAAYADVLPLGVIRHRKQGFMIPLGAWLRTDLREAMEDLLSPERVRMRGLFSSQMVQRLKHEHLAGPHSHSDRLWTLMMFELWMRHFLDRGGTWTMRDT